MAIREITTGQDSFLDIVANLVGVLIILIVIVGAQAASAWNQIEPDSAIANEIESVERQIIRAGNTVKTLEADNHALESDIQTQSMLAAVASENRHKTLVGLEVVRRELETQRKLLDEDQQRQFDQLSKTTELQEELDRIDRETKAVAANAPTIEKRTIEHHPTPISQTVFTNVIHVRLINGQLAVVPVDSLTDQMQREWKVKAGKLRDRQGISSTLETVGPIDNFRLQYVLEASGNRVTLIGYQIIALSENIGLRLSDVLKPGSDFMQTLSKHAPEDTTISIWLYPTELKAHRQLKNWLHQRGFKVASWLQEPGQSISFGPQGSHISAQ
jgi:hypothetical protein